MTSPFLLVECIAFPPAHTFIPRTFPSPSCLNLLPNVTSHRSSLSTTSAKKATRYIIFTRFNFFELAAKISVELSSGDAGREHYKATPFPFSSSPSSGGASCVELLQNILVNRVSFRRISCTSSSTSPSAVEYVSHYLQPSRIYLWVEGRI